MSPTELLAALLLRIRERVGDEVPAFAGQAPDEVVLTLPAAGSGAGPHVEKVLRDAAHEAGFAKVTLISEPEAAALAYAREVGEQAPELLVVLDCGGGTVDWTCLQRQGGRLVPMTECPPGGDDKVGGEYVDDELLAVVRERVDQSGDATAMADLERRQEALVGHLRGLRERFCIGRGQRVATGDTLHLGTLAVALTPADVQAVLGERFVDQVCLGFGRYLQSVRQHSGVAAPTVLLVGGAARMLGLREALQERCACKPVWWENSDFAPVLGAAWVGLVAAAAAQREAGEAPTPEKEDAAQVPVATAHGTEQAAAEEPREVAGEPPNEGESFADEVHREPPAPVARRVGRPWLVALGLVGTAALGMTGLMKWSKPMEPPRAWVAPGPALGLGAEPQDANGSPSTARDSGTGTAEAVADRGDRPSATDTALARPEPSAQPAETKPQLDATIWVVLPASPGDGRALRAIMRQPVTFAEYAECAGAGACPPAHWEDDYCFDLNGKVRLPPETRLPKAPAVCVDWDQARAWCRWAAGKSGVEASRASLPAAWDLLDLPAGAEKPAAAEGNWITFEWAEDCWGTAAAPPVGRRPVQDCVFAKDAPYGELPGRRKTQVRVVGSGSARESAPTNSASKDVGFRCAIWDPDLEPAGKGRPREP